MWKILGSTKVAIVLIGLILTLMIFSALIPQKDISYAQIKGWQDNHESDFNLIETLQLDRIYYSPFFFIILGCLGINLIFGNILRFKNIYKIENKLLKFRYIGSVLFHLSLLFIIISAILNFLYKYEGMFALTEGQSLNDSEDIYIREYKGPLYIDQYGRFSILLDSLNGIGTTDDRKNSQASVQLKFIPDITIEDKISFNNPINVAKYDFHYGRKRGFSPEIIVSDTTGNLLFRSFVRLASTIVDGKTVHRDFVELLDKKLKVEFEVEKIDKNNRYLSVELSTDTVNINRSGLVLGDSINIDSYIVKLNSVRQWCQLAVINNAYVDWIFFGFWTALAGLVVGFIPRVMKV